MLPNHPSTLSAQIVWDFQLAAMGSITRYGTLNSTRYKQYLPAGIEGIDRYPPRPIVETQYQMALRQYNSLQHPGA
jgi:hypothetical protein